ncbi:hypothetical protein [Yinghuangia seranimata]|uniref:hypothetical protein n=1 Tax=Yinghuangia seranimata TaxID=408067 RepID=UPI00248CD4D0|nr:hypothetical protein [Yinghuangia seranimata]MDI2124555.1 hypothetical protein [Yinghuangia seranimata]
MTEHDVREILGLAAEDDTGLGPDMAAILGAGRRARRRRRMASGLGAVTGVAVVAGVAVLASGVLGAAPKQAAGVPTTSMPAVSSPASPTAGPSGTPTAGPTSASAPPSARPTTSAEMQARMDDQLRREQQVLDQHGTRVTTIIVNTLDPSGTHITLNNGPSAGGLDSPAYYDVGYSHTWHDGERVGTLRVTFMGSGQDLGEGFGPLCGTLPHPNGQDEHWWASCTTETLPDGTVVKVGKGTSTDPNAITASAIHTDGSKVSVSMTVIGYGKKLDPDPPHLKSIPVTQDQLKALVSNPELRW